MNKQDILKTILEFQPKSFNKLSRSIINENGFVVITTTTYMDEESEELKTKFFKTFNKVLNFIIEDITVSLYICIKNQKDNGNISNDQEKLFINNIIKIKTLEDLQKLNLPIARINFINTQNKLQIIIDIDDLVIHYYIVRNKVIS